MSKDNNSERREEDQNLISYLRTSRTSLRKSLAFQTKETKRLQSELADCKEALAERIEAENKHADQFHLVVNRNAELEEENEDLKTKVANAGQVSAVIIKSAADNYEKRCAELEERNKRVMELLERQFYERLMFSFSLAKVNEMWNEYKTERGI